MLSNGHSTSNKKAEATLLTFNSLRYIAGVRICVQYKCCMKYFKTIRLLITLLLFTSFSAVGQTLPDSIIITKNTYVNSFTESDNLYETQKISVLKKGNGYIVNGDRIGKSKITDFLSAINNPSNNNNSLTKYQIDTTRIKNTPSELLSYYKNREGFAWNEKQKEFIYKELTNLENYRNELKDYLSAGCCYTMHSHYRNEYIIQIFSNAKVTEELKSRKFVWGYKLPWTNQSGDTLYNYDIETALGKIVKTKEKIKSPLTGNKLVSYLVSQIIDNNVSTLYALSAYSYLSEIEELKSDFEILSFNEVQGRGRYIWDEPATMRIRLKNEYMLDNVNIVFLASKTGKTIYSRDSLKKDYRRYIERVQSINFITSYLKSHPDTRLDIYYFNNKGINDYNIENINKNPTSWARHDKWVESLKWYKKNNIKPSFDIEQSIKTSQQNDCGCNYRFDRSYLEQAIFSEIRDNAGNSSIWFLLPDDKVLLYIMDSATTLNLKRSDFDDKKQYGLIYPCALFDKNGNRVTK